MKSPSKNKKKSLDETITETSGGRASSLVKTRLNSKAVTNSLKKKLKASSSTSKSANHLLELTLNESLVNANSSFAISPSSMSPTSSTYSSSSINQRASNKKRTPKEPHRFDENADPDSKSSTPRRLKQTEKRDNKNSKSDLKEKQTVSIQGEANMSQLKAVANSSNDMKVLVPSWRQVPIKRVFGMEGTENVSDEIFLKRHQKYENEEKQIKKWDMQRQRAEQERLKLLKARRLTNPVTICSSSNKNVVLNKIVPSDEENSLGAQFSHFQQANQSTNEKSRTAANRKNVKSNSLEIIYKTPDQVNLDDIQFVEIVDEKELKHIKVPTNQPIAAETWTNLTINNTINTTTVVPIKQDEHTANVTATSSHQIQTTPLPTLKKQPKYLEQSSSKQINVETPQQQQQPPEDYLTQKTFLNISNSPQKSPNKVHIKKESNNVTTIAFKTLVNNKNLSNKENQSLRKIRSKSLCSSELENGAYNEKNLKNSIFLNKSNSNLKASSLNENSLANFDTNEKNKIFTLDYNHHQNTNLKRKLSKHSQQQQSPDRKRKRFNFE